MRICRNAPTTMIVAYGYNDDFGVHPGQARITIDGTELDVEEVRHSSMTAYTRWLPDGCSVCGAAEARSPPSAPLRACSSHSQRHLPEHVWAHVVIMSIAWLFCAPVALTAARLRHFAAFKPFLTRTRFKGGRQLWYIVHRGLMMSAVLLTLLSGAFVLPFIQVHFQYVHAYFGILTMVCAGMQV